MSSPQNVPSPNPNNPAPNPTTMAVANPAQLVTESRAMADQLYSAVSTTYLQFRQTYFNEAEPSLANDPPLHPPAHQSETARLAQGALKVIPVAVRAVPLIGDLAQHLQRVVEIHTLTEKELLSLHNITMVFLYGVREGIQPWYAAYLDDSAHQLLEATHPDYFLAFPFHGLFYQTPEALVKLDIALRQGDVAFIEQHMQQLAQQLITVLHDPFKGQENLSFAGPDGERRKVVFNLKTTAGLAIGSYLGIEAVRSFISPHKDLPPPQAVIHMIPPEMDQYTLPPEA